MAITHPTPKGCQSRFRHSLLLLLSIPKYPLPSLTERNRILEGRGDETSIVWRVGIDWGFGTTNVTAPDDTIRKLQHAHRDEKGHEDVD